MKTSVSSLLATILFANGTNARLGGIAFHEDGVEMQQQHNQQEEEEHVDGGRNLDGGWGDGTSIIPATGWNCRNGWSVWGDNIYRCGKDWNNCWPDGTHVTWEHRTGCCNYPRAVDGGWFLFIELPDEYYCGGSDVTVTNVFCSTHRTFDCIT